jgi:hypothetical protein
MRIPTLAIHLDRGVNQDGFKPNFETHLAPVLATQVKAALDQPKKKEDKQVSTNLPAQPAFLRRDFLVSLRAGPTHVAIQAHNLRPPLRDSGAGLPHSH